jgi:hypothetical protein
MSLEHNIFSIEMQERHCQYPPARLACPPGGGQVGLSKTPIGVIFQAELV